MMVCKLIGQKKILNYASTYDPLGLLSPLSLAWDEQLPTDLTQQWMKIYGTWKGSIEIPRRYIKEKFPDDLEIHGFGDASKFAYCAAVYLRIPTKDGFETPLVFAKTRLQPMNKNFTIPQMEVMGIWLAAKIICYVVKEMGLTNAPKYLWTDSKIAFYWFKKWPKEVFVTNRLKEVLVANAECLFVPGVMNPADLGTRGILFDELQAASIWWKGPEFLRKSRDEWPKIPELAADLTQTIIALVSIGEEAASASMQIIETDHCEEDKKFR
uniref:Pao retrotransposon peptidase n=1 Tax=Panagrolaimus superbus TaxID=310955 RepID=A0A914Z272_9BILA